jgi:tRNA-2-methylthio-N6-dimethylallyladenosine synthase
MSGRARDGRLVHFAVGDTVPRPGDVIETVVTYAAPHNHNSDGVPLSHRRTKAGDAFEAGRTPRLQGVSLGLPTIGVPAPLPATTGGCAV